MFKFLKTHRGKLGGVNGPLRQTLECIKVKVLCDGAKLAAAGLQNDFVEA